MKKILFVTISLIILLLSLQVDNDNNYLAINDINDNESPKLNLVCPSVVLEDEEFYCNVNITDVTKTIEGIELNYQIDDAFSIVSFDNTDSWTNIGSSSNTTILTSEALENGKINLGNLILKSTSNSILNNEYNIDFNAKIVYKNDLDNYTNLSSVNSKFIVSNISNIFNYIKINNTSLDIKDGIKEYNIELDNDITSTNLEISLNDNIENINIANNENNKNINDLKIGNNEEYVSILSNNIEIFKLKINLFRNDNNKLTESDEIDENPQTGISSLIIVFAIFILSLFMLLSSSKKVLEGEK